MEFKDKQAIYLQIADYFCENILLENWKEQEKIPSVRQISIQLEVNPNTAMRTYAYLQEKEIIFNKRGIGYFVSEGGLEKTQNLVRTVFFNNDVPAFFKSMDILNITFDDLREAYENRDSCKSQKDTDKE